MTVPALKFIDCAPGDEAHAARIRRAVRSHVAKAAKEEGWELESTTRKRRKRRRQCFTWVVNIPQPDTQHHPGDSESESQHSDSGRSITPLTALSGSTLIPASKSPVYREPFISVVVENYLEHLAVAIPEVDGQGETALLKTRWFPMVIHSPTIFQVIVLFSASHYASYHDDLTLIDTILSLKQCALNGIADAISRSGRVIPDELIAATAKMASYEAIYGDQRAYHSHMNGVEQMLKVRGGLYTLGLEGFLSRLLVFIDTNSAFLLHTHLHLTDSSFPRLPPFMLPNISRFIGDVANVT